MLVNIHEIAEDGLDFDLERPDFVVEQGTERLPFRQVRGRFHLERQGDQIQISGEVSAVVTIRCSRCSKEFSLPVKENFDFRGIPGHHLRFPDTQELSSDELEVTFLEGDEIDLDEIIRENIYLSMPIRPVCSESCRGLCSRCGKDLNEGDCACEEARIDLRFQSLGILRQKISPKAE
jgi:uncharacterized protein